MGREVGVRMQGLEATQLPLPTFVLLSSYLGAGKVKCCTSEETVGTSLREINARGETFEN